MSRFSESFDSYNGFSAASGGILARWLSSTASNINMGAGRFGGQAVTPGSGASSRDIWTSLGFTSDEFSMSIAAKFSGSSDQAGVAIGLGQDSGRQVAIRYDSLNGKFSLCRGGSRTSSGTVLWTESGTHVPNVWHTLRLRGLIHGSVGELHLKIDNEPEISLTGLNTQALGDANITHVILSSHNTQTIGTFDDLVVEDSMAVILPECRIQSFAPTSDGGTLDLTPSTGVDHYAVVDEPIVSLTDYLSGTTVGDIDLLGVADLAVIPGSILGVKAIGWAAKTDVASRSWNLGVESGGTTDNGPDLSLTTDPQFYEHEMPVDPDTLVEWTQSGVNALQLQPRVAV